MSADKGSLTTYILSVLGALVGWMADNPGVIAAGIPAFLTWATTYYFKRRQDRRDQEAHDARMRERVPDDL